MPETPLHTSRAHRTLQPAGLALRATGRWLRASLSRAHHREERRKDALLRTGADVARTMGDMKGAAMKLGQVMSLMTGVVPEEMSSQLTTLHATAPPMAYELVEAVFKGDLGASPERVFRRFERTPFAAASIGQVHRAWLDDGRPVAVKVQYPGVGEAITHDLANIGALVGMVGMFSNGLDAATIVRDLREGIRAELDYQREAADQHRFVDIYRGHPFIRVPEIVPELTSSHVLTQEYLAGRPFREAVSLPEPERNRIAEIVYRFAFGSLYRHRLFNGDPHPGNYLLLDDGRVGFVDYGCVSEFGEPMIEGFRSVIRALVAGDLPAWRRGVEHIGILKPGAPFSVDELYDHMHWYWAPILEERVRFTPDMVSEMIRRNTQTTGRGGQINRWCNVPEGMVFLTRINFGLAGVFAGLQAEGPWRAIIEEYVNGTPPATELGRLSREATPGGFSV